MSRIGNRILIVPTGVSIELSYDKLKILGPHGSLEVDSHNDILDIKLSDSKIVIKRKNEEKFTRMIHGTTNANINNALIGVNVGHTKKLKIVGVGYKAMISGNYIDLYLGHSHNIKLEIPKDIKVSCLSTTEVLIFGPNKTTVGEFASIIRSKRPPEPYKGKGVMYYDEKIIRKVGKTADGGKK